MRERPLVACAFGTRPDAIKMAPVVQRLKAEKKVETRVVVTGQHREMLDPVLRVFGITPDEDLRIMEPGQTLYDITTRCLLRFGEWLRRVRPSLVLVHGDTTTCFSCALAAFYERIPVGHVEAGLRSYNYDIPFPEEANRRLTDAIASLHFAPTATAARRLRAENIPARHIYVTGNTVVDAVLQIGRREPLFREPVLQRLFGNGGPAPPALLVTAHRRESFGEILEGICGALREIAGRFPDLHILYPVHLNPNVQAVAHRALNNHPRIHLLAPLDYTDFVPLMRRVRLILTDSGGIQEEAPAFHRPVLVMRKATERPEAEKAGTVKVIGVDPAEIVRWTSRLLTDTRLYRRMARARNPYGDGRAGERTVQGVLHFLGLRRGRPAAFRCR